MARKKPHEDHLNHEAWAIPYGDLITLLLAFFVVMYAISTVNEGKYRVLSNSLSIAFGGPLSNAMPGPGADALTTVTSSNVALDIRPRMDLAALSQRSREARQEAIDEAVISELQNALSGLLEEGKARLQQTDKGVEISLSSDFLFSSGSAKIFAKADPILVELAAILRGMGYPLTIEGHTDNVPIATAQFPSNWELSAARAAWVARRLAENGVVQQALSIQGYSQFKPIAPNLTPLGRAANRRVAIAINTRAELLSDAGLDVSVAQNLQEVEYE